MILVDSSAFIEYYRPSGDASVSAAVAEAITLDSVAVNGVIQVELTAFVSRQADRATLVADLQAFHWLEVTHSDFDLAAQIGFDLRRHGITIPATDLIIAACAIGAEAALYHLDTHFDHIASRTDLNARNLAPHK